MKGLMNRQDPYHMAILLSALLLTTAGCSREGAQKSAAQTTSPAESGTPASNKISECSFIGRDDIARAVGNPVTDVEEGMKSAMTSQCTFVTGTVEWVDVIINRSPVNYDVAAEIAAMKKAMPGVPFREVTGIGDQAFLMGGQLSVYRGDLYVLVSMLGFEPDPKATAAAEKIAAMVLSRL
jgi:hypothetical protein